jgi:mycothiol synthase
MSDVVIRPYRGSDEADLLRVWNAALTHDPINEATWRTRVLLDANFAAAGLLVAERAGGLCGFVLSIARQVPLFLPTRMRGSTRWPASSRCGALRC